ncbi:hypothetical protein DL89DRAFT_268565 [Linderina pennispora]|uniref:Velvet domain-containing protein n=1 Tax=Linderina pennispora TaxID=61395 RepID=A0A1Y1W5I3_9FUNG|nr:uncharacterized protein DL89DRAFT_268565 [Linderina pennispora]ORX68793.1 hypothetical protein DL89DRAFT_268565 [Linderina pennispora]
MTNLLESAESGEHSDSYDNYDSKCQPAERIPAYRNEADIRSLPPHYLPDSGAQPMAATTDGGSDPARGYSHPEPRSDSVARLDPRTMPIPDDNLSKINPRLRMFKLVIVQQPIRARMCGSSDKDWRPVSPPPVLKLVLYDHDGNSVIDNSFMQHLVIHTTLWKDSEEEELTVVELPHNTNSKRISAAAKSRKRGPGLELENNLLGDYTASSSIVEDEAGEKGCRYRLRFSLIKLPSMDDYQQPMVPMCISSISTNAFDVYSIKTFPGMIESTPLSKALAQQGLKIPIRNTQDSA